MDTATHCNTLQHVLHNTATHLIIEIDAAHTATQCYTMQGTAMQHTATHLAVEVDIEHNATHCNALQCNTLQHTSTTHCYIEQPTLPWRSILNTMQYNAMHCNATHYNTLQHTAAHLAEEVDTEDRNGGVGEYAFVVLGNLYK